MKTALITGIDGQVGSYLADLLLEKEYRVVGWMPATVPVSTTNIEHILDRVTLVEGDLADQASLDVIILTYRPDEVYNLAAPSFPAGSWNHAVLTGDIAGLGVARLLDALLSHHPAARFYPASTSEMFGDPIEVPQSEETPFRPRNPYGIAKLFAHWITVRSREHHGMFAVTGIMFNTESPRRHPRFVTRKITRAAASIKLGLQDSLSLGELEARRDWGYAGDYVRAMWKMLQEDQPQDYVIGSGVTHSVRDLCDLAFSTLDLDYLDYVLQDERYMRPSETAQLVANPRKAHRQLGWQPEVPFDELVRMMVHSDLEGLQSDA